MTQLANQHGSDKGTVGPSSRWIAHNYTDVYEAYLSNLRDKPITLLEIGLGVDGPGWKANIQHGRNSGGGASIKMWRDYFPQAQVLGLDINPAAYLDSERLRTFVADQGDRASLERFVKQSGVEFFDVIVDDGSHDPEHQQISLGVLFPYVKTGGYYFIEDLVSNGVGDGASGRAANSNFLNTRKVLSGFEQTREFPVPHAIPQADYLMRHVASVSFHCPKPVTHYKLKPSRWKRPISRVAGYVPGTEFLSLIRKAE